MILPVLAILVTRGRRERHIGYLETDPLTRRFCALRQLVALLLDDGAYER